MTQDYETPPLPFAGDPDRTCPYCGQEEPTTWLLENNHRPDSARAQPEGLCVAMELTRSHVHHHVQAVLDARANVATAQLHDQPAKRAQQQLAQTEKALSRSVARAREVWPDPTWVTNALAVLLADPIRRPR